MTNFIFNNGTLTISDTEGTELKLQDIVYELKDHDIDDVKKLVIGEGITKIYNRYFLNCYKLQEVEIGEGVEELGSDVFKFCMSLKKVHLPSSLKKIGKGCFSCCYDLTDINIPESIEVIDEEVFESCESLTNITLPSRLKEIKNYAFYICKNLKSITFPDSVEKVHELSFDGCDNLKEIIVGKNLSHLSFLFSLIGPSPESIIIDETNPTFTVVDNIIYSKNKKILYYCPRKKTTVNIIDGVITVNYNAFSRSNITHIKLPSTVEYILGEAFLYCYFLTSVNLGESLRFVDETAFYGCKNLRHLVMDKPKNNPNCLDDVIESKKAVNGFILSNDKKKLLRYTDNDKEDVVIPESVEVIGKMAFKERVNIKHITLPKNLKKIEKYAFYRCHNLREIFIPSSVEVIESNAFDKNFHLEKIVIEEGKLKKLPHSCFSNGLSLHSITLPETLEEIGEFCFYKCREIKEVDLPDNIKAIQQLVFYNCEALEKVHLPSELVELGSDCFCDCTSLKEIYIPNGVKKIPMGAFSECTSLTTLKLPDYLDFIDLAAFANCNNLKHIYMPLNKPKIEKRNEILI